MTENKNIIHVSKEKVLKGIPPKNTIPNLQRSERITIQPKRAEVLEIHN